MTTRRNLALISTSDFIARTAYQMGKTPLLPLFALTLGATDLYLGFIVSVSTLTGMILKPLVGVFSDYGGRLRWLVIGSVFFVVMPFTYRFVQTPEQLLIVRLIHGLATAVYGPVTVAYVIELGQDHSAENLGWFSLARSGGYIFGPLLAGAFLAVIEPVQVFTIIGLLSCLIFVPLLLLPRGATVRNERSSLWPELRRAFDAIRHQQAVWLAGGIEILMFIATYTLKTFLPIYAVAIGLNVFFVGLFFSVQELVTVLTKPLAGRIADRIGYLPITLVGLCILGVTLMLLPPFSHYAELIIIVSVLIGVAQALVSLAAVAYVGQQVEGQYLGASLGVIGSMDNAGKVAGPLLAGVLLTQLDFPTTVVLIGLVLLGAVLLVAMLKLTLKQANAPRTS